MLRVMHRPSTHPHLSALGPSSSTDTKSSWKASSAIPHLITHSAQLKYVDQLKNTFCTPEQCGAAALGSHHDSCIWKSHDQESGPNLPLLWITKHQEACTSILSSLPKGKSSTALLSLKSISCLRHSNKKTPPTAETFVKCYPAPA